MIKGLIDGISVAIDAEFNSESDKYEIYTQLVEQGMEKPCFSIVLLKPSIEQVVGKRYFRRQPFCIYYFPETEDVQTECYEVQERLEDILELITADGDLVRGTEMNGEIVDGVLAFLVNYNFYVMKDVEQADAMETLTNTTDVKG